MGTDCSYVPGLNAGTHLLAVIEGDDERSVSAVFSVDDQTSEDDGYAWQPGGNRGRHEPIQFSGSRCVGGEWIRRHLLGSSWCRGVEKELPGWKHGSRSLNIANIQPMSKLRHHVLTTETMIRQDT